MPTDLTPAERDDREADRLLDRKRAPSRKHRDKRAPRPYQRQRRVRDTDTDTDTASYHSDEDLDRYVRDLDSVMKDLDADDVDSWDFDAAIDALSDPGEAASAEAKLVEEAARRRREEADSAAAWEADLKDALGKSDLDQSRLDELDRALGLSASNRAWSPMSPRTSAYHGVLDVRGNPTDPPGSSYAGPDRRDFTQKDYEAIVKLASKLLEEEDWLRYGWDGGAEDAPVRAALDLAIQTAGDGALYQSKIDPETYNLLLNRLAKWGYDTFSDTVLPTKAPQSGTRSATIMKNTESYQSIIRVASDLRETNPLASFEIVKSLRALVSTEAEPARSISEEAEVGAPKASVAASPAPAQASVASEEDLAEVPLSTLLKVAASSDSAKVALGPFILAAAKKKDKKKGKGKGKVPPQFLQNMKGKGDAPPAKGKKAAIASEDASW